jgi:hypothetical protein
VIKKEAEDILKYKDLIQEFSACGIESKRDTDNNVGDWNKDST